MPFIVWNDRLSVNVEVLDADHKRLVEILNSLYDAIKSGTSRDILDGILDDLSTYTQTHFAREEELFAATNYPDAERHRSEHQSMVRWLDHVHTLHRHGLAVAPALEAVTYLKDWLFDHILGSDQMYRAHLRAAGVR